MTLFASWYWGFDPETWPFAGFPTEWGRRRLLEKSDSSDDRLVFVASSKANRVPRKQKGCILGFVRFGREEIYVPDYYSTGHFPTELLKDRQFRWPYAVPILQAWRLERPPHIVDAIGRQISSAGIQSIEQLNSKEAARIMAYDRVEVIVPPLPPAGGGARLQTVNQASGPSARRGGQPGPAPAAWSGIVARSDGPTATYLAQFGDHPAWKIGISQNPIARMAALNFSIPRKVTNCEWRLRRETWWENGAAAYAIERAILDSLADLDPSNEQVVCSLNRIDRTWRSFTSCGKSATA